MCLAVYLGHPWSEEYSMWLRKDRGRHPAGVVGLAVAALVAHHAGEDLRRVPAVVAHDPALHQHSHQLVIRMGNLVADRVAYWLASLLCSAAASRFSL